MNEKENRNREENEIKEKDLIEDNEDIEEEENKEDENKNENGTNNSKDNSSNISEKEEEEKPKEKIEINKYIPRNEQEALKAKIIKLELKEKPHEEIDYSYNFKVHENIETDIKNKNKFKIPKELKKTFIIVLILAILGITLIICGFIKAISDATPGGGIMFWVLGIVVMIPGGFYSYQFYKAKKAKEEYRRQDILDNIPQL